MPLLDSFKVDHTKMNAPAVRVAKTMTTPKGDTITVFDLRFCRPNIDILPVRGIHTMEHLLPVLCVITSIANKWRSLIFHQWVVVPVFICH